MSTRKSNFKNDYEIYGKFGEDDFKAYCEQINKFHLDTSDVKMFQVTDIDCIISDRVISCVEADNLKNNPIKQGKLIFDSQYKERENCGDKIKVEIKTDTRSLNTHNIVYEEHNNYQPGCAGKSMADYWYYVFVEDNLASGGSLVKKEAWWIDVYKLREYIDEHFYFALQVDWSHYNEPNYRDIDPNYNKFDVLELYKEYGIQTKKFIDKNENDVEKTICNLLIKIYKLEKYGIATRVF